MVKIAHNENLFLIIIILIILFVIVVFINFKINKKTALELTDEDIKTELEKLEKINVYPDNKKINVNSYPKVLGKYSKNGLTLVEIYECSDLCPNNAKVHIIFENVSEEECSKIGGEEIKVLFFPQYVGCAPKINITDKDAEKEIDKKEEVEKVKECVTDNDCVPSSCCHPSSCVSINNKPNCEGIFCTQECAPGTLDCNQGYCGCISGKCSAVFSD